MNAFHQSISRRRILKPFLAYGALTLLCIGSFQYRVFVDYSTFHGDESMWLANANAFSLFMKGDFDAAYWQGYLGWSQPHAGHYLYGIVLHVAGYEISPKDLPDRYDWRHDFVWNATHGRVPRRDVLVTMRRFNAVCAALACLLLCEVGRRTFGWIAGMVAACWLAANPLMRFVCQRAMIDAPVTLALVGGVFVLCWLFQAWQRGTVTKVMWMSLAIGAFLGIAAAMKPNAGVLCLVAVGAWVCDIGFRVASGIRSRASARSVFRSMGPSSLSVVVVCGCAVVTFYGLNPQMWPKGLIGGTQEILASRSRDVANQRSAHPDLALSGSSQHIAVAVNNYFVKWSTLRLGPVEAFRQPSSAGKRTDGLWYLEAPLFCIGIIGLMATIVLRWRRERAADPACVLLVWFVAYSTFVFFLVPLDWPRYYQKYLPIQALLVGIAVHTMFFPLRAWIARRPSEAMDQSAQTLSSS